MSMDLVIDIVPFALYSALLIKVLFTWLKLKARAKSEFIPEATPRNPNLMMAIVLLLAICTMTFMAANAYALVAMDKALLSLRVFQMFVIGNCAAYWLVLDLISDR